MPDLTSPIKFTRENFEAFRKAYYGHPSGYPNQRLGQAFMNNFEPVEGLEVFYEETDALEMILFKLDELEVL